MIVCKIFKSILWKQTSHQKEFFLQYGNILTLTYAHGPKVKAKSELKEAIDQNL